MEEKQVITPSLSGGERKRLDWLDVAKGLGIFLVVYGHAKAPRSILVYLFHMPLFFLLSGFVHNSRDSLKDFVLKKIRSIYLPYVGWNTIFLILRTLPKFFRGEATENYLRRQLELWLKVLLTVEKEGAYLGATWFLGALFSVQILYKLFEVSVKEGRYKYTLLFLLFALPALSSFYLPLPGFLNRTVILSMFYPMGHLMRRNWEQLKDCFHPVTGLWAALIFWWLGQSTRANMGSNEYSNIGLFLIAALLGSYAVICLSMVIGRWQEGPVLGLKKVCSLFGRGSLDIVIWHFVLFRLVSGLQFWLEGKSVLNALGVKVYEAGNGWWLAYLAVGLFGSLALARLLRAGPWGRALKKIHLV